VRSDGEESSVGAVTCEVPQGSVLGPPEDYQVLPFSYLCGGSADLSHLCCFGLSKVYTMMS
jgi:hypothetical protein